MSGGFPTEKVSTWAEEKRRHGTRNRTIHKVKKKNLHFKNNCFAVLMFCLLQPNYSNWYKSCSNEKGLFFVFHPQKVEFTKTESVLHYLLSAIVRNKSPQSISIACRNVTYQNDLRWKESKSSQTFVTDIAWAVLKPRVYKPNCPMLVFPLCYTKNHGRKYLGTRVLKKPLNDLILRITE